MEKIYQTLIDDGVETIMVGHILLPYYTKYINPEINDEDILPASMSKEILSGSFKGKIRV